MEEVKKLVELVRNHYGTNDFVPLHAPRFNGNEKRYVSDTLESTFVSSVGAYVGEFEDQVCTFTGAGAAVATVNGTAALHTALFLSGVKSGDIVITQALTFVATCNIIAHLGATPLFIDVCRESLSLCPIALEDYLSAHSEIRDGQCYHTCGARIASVMPMHTFGHPAKMDALKEVCERYHITLVEDAAESLGSFYKNQHTGTFADFSALSFNGNKVITTGGGGMVLCGTPELGQRAKHITTTAKVAHAYEFYHDELAFNYRMPNINAALGCAQMEQLPAYLKNKRRLAATYKAHFNNSELVFVDEPQDAHSNFWLNALLCPSRQYRDAFLEQSNSAGIMTRPVWQLMHTLPMFNGAPRGPLTNSEFLADHLVNIPSSVAPEKEVR
ncbi:LegC family aminotransferase [Pseudoalteromonas sp. MM17-2]|uniref:LegC family aminotransferase n=1 Tax=Pseudoalteromonas sp. MM17-2 TaxID=2917753 RepID=UPI001EF6A19D|nr:LegC family aminotransferase [Pseudoalteromonas sp. MM17-2]MCG7544864.1 LegC family aminotransferase [Pseudoalteromonas sp. MM17-2]